MRDIQEQGRDDRKEVGKKGGGRNVEEQGGTQNRSEGGGEGR